MIAFIDCITVRNCAIPEKKLCVEVSVGFIPIDEDGIYVPSIFHRTIKNCYCEGTSIELKKSMMNPLELTNG